MKHLTMKGMEIHSLPELRSNFDLTQATAAFLDGTLVEWLEHCYYEREAGAVEALEHTLSPAVEKKLCEILGVDYMEHGNLTTEQRESCEKKLALLRQYTQAPDVLSHALETATNQIELAELLNGGITTVYLCAGPFAVPIRKSGIHYIGIGNPQMETPFTQEQYRRAGITFEGVTLPETVDETCRSIAEQAATDNGYDDFAEKHNRLASLFHNAMKSNQVTEFLSLDYDTCDVSGELYSSRSAAEQAAHQVVNQAYDQANNYFIPGKSGCLAETISKRYSVRLRSGVEKIVERLKPYCGQTAHLGEQLKLLEDQVIHAEQKLRKLFEQELSDSSDYYRMYQRSYFLDNIEIETFDFNVDLFDNDLLNSLAHLILDETEYTVEKLAETVMELEEDVKKHANTFFSCAYREYRSYCKEIEKIAEEIGKDLSSDDLIKLGISENEVTHE